MEYCCHIWAGAPSFTWNFLTSLKNEYDRLLVLHFLLLLNPWLIVEMYLSLFYRYYFVKCSSELAKLVPLPFSRGRSARYSDRLYDCSVTIRRCYKDLSFLGQLGYGILCL